jgi:hypothetical protein
MQQAVELVLTSDSAQLTNSILHVAVGLKCNDMVAICGRSQSIRFCFTNLILLFRSAICFPLRIVIAKDNRRLLLVFDPGITSSMSVRWRGHYSVSCLRYPSPEI